MLEGVASVNESALTGESAPVIRESGGDRSAVTGGAVVLSDWLVVRITANPGETSLDRMSGMVEGSRRQKTTNLSATAMHPYNAFDGEALAGSAGSNLGPLSPALPRRPGHRLGQRVNVLTLNLALDGLGP